LFLFREALQAINHPGKYLFALSTGNDVNFQLLNELVDTQNDAVLPHTYSTKITMPNINCDTCTLQLVQVMEENPNVPTYYYSCADIKIVASPVSHSCGGACGLVKKYSTALPSFKIFSVFFFLFFIVCSPSGSMGQSSDERIDFYICRYIYLS